MDPCGTPEQMSIGHDVALPRPKSFNFLKSTSSLVFLQDL